MGETLTTVFERFTERARHVIVVAQEEARALHHNYIGTEHLLLGLLHDRETAAGHALAALGIRYEEAHERVAQICKPSEELSSGQIPFTPRGKKVLELALREALALQHNYIGVEHVLLGLVREGEGVANRVLLELGATPERLREEVLRRLPDSGDRPGRGTTSSGVTVSLSSTPEMRAGDLAVMVAPDPELRQFLLTAAGRALADQRTEFNLADLLAAAGVKPDDP